jgi:hypothetical protein
MTHGSAAGVRDVRDPSTAVDLCAFGQRSISLKMTDSPAALLCDHYFVITPQAIRSPELPEGSVL